MELITMHTVTDLVGACTLNKDDNNNNKWHHNLNQNKDEYNRLPLVLGGCHGEVL